MEVNIAIFSLFLLASFLLAPAADNGERKAYIVYMGNALKSKTLAAEHHHSLLSEIIQDEEVARRSRIYSYGKSFNAFAAYLLPDEAERLQENENVVSVFPSTIRQLYTTRSWDFMGMPLSVQRSQTESDIIVGIMDTGIYMNSPSFNDKGFGPPPSKWKGICAEAIGNFSGCNNKVIGARVYNLENIIDDPNLSPVDLIGHGSHTASTVAGVPVEGASLYGLGQGTARGGSPLARIAVYRVCHPDGCADSDILAAFDDAIDDGVDILSLSLGSLSRALFTDVIAIGSFHAMKKGILTSAACGNSGPHLSSLSNGAPWMLTVGATSSDRLFKTPIIIGNKTEILGSSVNTFNLSNEMYPLITTVNTSRKGVQRISGMSPCSEEFLDEEMVKGKIVFCTSGYYDPSELIKRMGGVGTIIVREVIFAIPYVGPCACVYPETGESILKYIDSTKDPQAVILKSIRTQDSSAPSVAYFSSRGPDVNVPSILKPDIVAPGVEILAAYTKLSPITETSGDDRFSEYSVLSGTSMACPHASAAAAYVKSFHPDWYTSAIRSALMTTASEIKVGDKSAEFAYGAGLIQPQKAVQPGLVYELEEIDYIRYLCNQNYTERELRTFTNETVNCSSIPKFGGQDDLNYPSMVVMQKDIKSSISAVFERTVKNVGDANATYKVNVTAPANIEIKVTPDTLVFTEVNEKNCYTVEVKGPPLPDKYTVISASLEWTDSVHKVRSPITIYFPSR